MTSPAKVYRFHVINLREVEKALKNISSLARKAIADQDESGQLRSLVRLYALVLGWWAETRLLKLLNEPGAFEPEEATRVLSEPSRLEQWKALVDLSFRKHFTVNARSLTRMSLGQTNFARNRILHDTLRDDLATVIQVRNKLAHGQWIYPLNNQGTDVNSDYFRKLNEENIQSLQFKYALLRHLADVIHDLAVSPDAFERDFDQHFRKLDQARINLTSRPYETYVMRLITIRRRYRAGRDPTV